MHYALHVTGQLTTLSIREDGEFELFLHSTHQETVNVTLFLLLNINQLAKSFLKHLHLYLFICCCWITVLYCIMLL